MTASKRVRVVVYVPQSLQIAYNPKTGEASAAMTFLRLRRERGRREKGGVEGRRGGC